MADTRDRTDPVELGQEQARVGDAGPDDGTPSSRPPRRHPIFIVLAIVLGVVVYALAFEQTQVDLTQITSETRQRSLENILRNLARPNLVTYDTTDQATDVEVAIPCGPQTAPTAGLEVTPACGEPGDTVTVTGSGYEPRQAVTLHFVPDSEFVITLRLLTVNTDATGAFSTEVTLPDRTSEEPQAIRAVTQEPIGTWGNRVRVYTDANENGVEDDPIMGEEGTRVVSIEGAPEVPAVALLDPANAVQEFVTTGEPFEATGGTARGETALPLGETESTGLHVAAIDTADGSIELTVAGPPGTDMSNWRAALYDGTTGDPGTTTYISDTIQLSPRVSDTARLSLDKILETVFLALVATTAGLLLAVPLSFVAARNIMRDISITVTNLVLVLIAVPLGAGVGVLASRAVRTVADPLAASTVGLLVATAVAGLVAWFLIRRALPTVETGIPTRAERIQRGALLVLAGVAALTGLLFASRLLEAVGNRLTGILGWFGFIGSFFAAIGEILDVTFPVIAALAVAAVFAHLASKLGYAIRSRSPQGVVRTLNVVLAAVAGAVWGIVVGQVIDWFYLIGDIRTVVVIPAVAGAAIAVAIALRGMHKGEVDVGLSIYYAARTVFNTLRSIEPLVMAIVFVVWVGAGPFAGSLALALHTAAALAKLYSEQVESISAGPIEAVRATGANRLQTIIYAVVPQIVPPYISFTMYRWDINVRMSTILGFVGGGGIGSILQQNINLLQYSDAAVQMLAIAIVVATMDWASSRMREHYV